MLNAFSNVRAAWAGCELKGVEAGCWPSGSRGEGLLPLCTNVLAVGAAGGRGVGCRPEGGWGWGVSAELKGVEAGCWLLGSRGEGLLPLCANVLAAAAAAAGGGTVCCRPEGEWGWGVSAELKGVEAERWLSGSRGEGLLPLCPNVLAAAAAAAAGGRGVGCRPVGCLPQFCMDELAAAAAAAEEGAGAGCCHGGGTAVRRKGWWGG